MSATFGGEGTFLGSKLGTSGKVVITKSSVFKGPHEQELISSPTSKNRTSTSTSTTRAALTAAVDSALGASNPSTSGTSRRSVEKNVGAVDQHVVEMNKMSAGVVDVVGIRGNAGNTVTVDSGMSAPQTPAAVGDGENKPGADEEYTIVSLPSIFPEQTRNILGSDTITSMSALILVFLNHR